MVYSPNLGLFKKRKRRSGIFGAYGRVVVDENPDRPICYRVSGRSTHDATSVAWDECDAVAIGGKADRCSLEEAESTRKGKCHWTIPELHQPHCGRLHLHRTSLMPGDE
jgi:hypothetical protein